MSNTTIENHVPDLKIISYAPPPILPGDESTAAGLESIAGSIIIGPSESEAQNSISRRHPDGNGNVAASFPQLSATTEEILKRVSANASAHTGGPGWEAARQQVLQSMVTSDKLLAPVVMTSKRGRGRGKARVAAGGIGRGAGDFGRVNAQGLTNGTPSVGRVRGGRGGRGRGRGRGRGGKRKRAESASSVVWHLPLFDSFLSSGD